MAVQQYELSIIFRAALLKADSENPVTSAAANAISTQPQPPIMLQRKYMWCCANVYVFSDREQLKKVLLSERKQMRQRG